MDRANTSDNLEDQNASRTVSPEPPPDPPPNQDWVQRVDRAFMEADDLVLPYAGKRIRSSRVGPIRKTAEKVSRTLRDGHQHCDPERQARITDYRRRIVEVCVWLEQLDSDSEEGSTQSSPAGHSTPRHNNSGHDRSPPRTAIEFEHRSVVYLLDLISNANLPDVEDGIDLDTETLKDLHDVKVNEVKGIIKDCRDAIGKYASRHGCDPQLVNQAQRQCERAFEWTRQVVSRYRAEQHHLAGNVPAREITFTVFDPSGDISVYEFLKKYEEWARGYISADAKAHLLFSKYLPKSLTEGYEELKSKKTDYEAMKIWLFNQYGNVTRVVDNQLKAIRALKKPKSEDDLQGQAQYLRKIHHRITALYGLEVSKGTLVPGLRQHMESNTFLTHLVEVLPTTVQKSWSEFLADDGETVWKVEGRIYLDKILSILRKSYTAYEIQAAFPSDPQPKPKLKANHARDSSLDGIVPTAAATGSPLKSKAKNTKTKASTQNSSNPSIQWSRWSCPMEGHEKHDITSCKRFFHLTVKQRRTACRWQACWTCLGRRDDKGNCKKGECSRLSEIPTLLVCQDCAVSNRKGPPLNVLMCGLASHKKPSSEAIGEALEKWIPGFKLSQLTSPLVVNLSRKQAAPAGIPPRCQSSAPSSTPPSVTFDTRTGKTRKITSRDTVVMPSQKEAFFIMQQLSIGGEEILTFYHSGAKVHLVEGELAERVGFTVLDDHCVSIGVVGGGQVWSEYGQYACVLGPDTDHKLHQIECQGLARITSYVPQFDVRPLESEASQTFRDGNRLWYPKSVGGDRVKLLLGIRSTALAPKLHASLPNGLGVYISALVDVNGSNICYGGTHEIFTRGYAKAGMSASHLQVLFTQIATAYMRAPYPTITAKCEDHGPSLKQVAPYLTEDQWQDNLGEWFEARGEIGLLPKFTSECHCADIGLCDTPAQCLKATIPLSKLKGLIDEDDIPVVKDVRCDKCKNCPNCKLSSRAKTQSLQEAFEQEVIEKSVTINLEAQQVRVELPFIKKPAEFLTNRHKGNDNFKQAIVIYRSQCAKPEEIKSLIRAAHEELVAKGFMVPLSSLPEKQQRMIESAPFKHFYPWRATYKPGSVSTPVRLVVDPSCTGLNIILAKGRNMLAQIPDILIRLRTKRSAWTTDISKLYNQLFLTDSALPFSLFLYDSSLSESSKPEVWVMTRAWYGVSSTGNQATVAIKRLAELNRDTAPLAFDLLTSDIYVDDIASGADSNKAREAQINQTKLALGTGGFSMKFVARSGHPPPEDASTDGKSVGCLGLSWDTECDVLSPSIASMNLQKKIRGQKAAPDRDVTTADGLRSALKDGLITRAGVLSRMAELFDPVGWWEPLRLQMKLSFQEMNSLDWKSPVPEELHETWINHFLVLEQASSLTIPRCVIPPSAPPDWKIRLICL
ncbi:MAG: hypothetical protein FJ333_04060, partial [Sphingomonadales bacterium]|nr:hypothetical protein [Sphingomonadales bacterium]